MTWGFQRNSCCPNGQSGVTSVICQAPIRGPTMVLMRDRLPAAMLALWVFACSTGIAQAQQTESPEGSARKVLNRVSPAYPSLARNLNMSGMVRLEAVVSSGGAVKTLSVKGGNPVLVKAAEDAVTKWKGAPASHETQELIELNFKP